MNLIDEKELIKWIVASSRGGPKPKPGFKYQCQECLEIIQSMHRHDFVTCGCGHSSVDGGGEYSRILYKKLPPLIYKEPNVQTV